MTIGWATVGVIWSKPILMVAVRDSRHTFGIIEKAADFTVTVPTGEMVKELAFCGAKSGREHDKFKECNMTPGAARKTVSPIVQVPGIHFECRIVYKSAMDPALLDTGYDKDFWRLPQWLIEADGPCELLRSDPRKRAEQGSRRALPG